MYQNSGKTYSIGDAEKMTGVSQRVLRAWEGKHIPFHPLPYNFLIINVLIIPNVAKAGGLQSQGVKGEAVVVYRESLATPDLMSSGFPEG